MDAAEWDARYARSELVWGAPPNATVVAHIHGLERFVTPPPGELPRALDLACGEGRNALWLATHGWRVRAVDFSQVGVDKGRTVAARLSRSVRERITWECADVTETDCGGPFDLILVVFLHLPATRRRALLRDAAASLAPSGVLFVLGHDTSNPTEGYGGPQDPDILFTPQDVVDDLTGTGLELLTAERISRATEERDAIDALVVTRAPAADDVTEV